MEKLNLKPNHKAVQNYYEALRQFKTIGVSHEDAVRSAFQTLLEHCSRATLDEDISEPVRSWKGLRRFFEYNRQNFDRENYEGLK